MEKKRYLWLDIIKIIACFLVIVNHTILIMFDYSAHSNISVLFFSIYFSICKVAVPLFITTTGCLLLGKEQNYKNMIQKTFRIIVPLLVVSLYWFYPAREINAAFLLGFAKSVIKSPNPYYLWYLYMLIFLYLLTPLLQKLYAHSNKRDFLLLFVLLILAGSIPIINTYSFMEVGISPIFRYAFLPNAVLFYIFGKRISEIELTKRYFAVSIIVFISFLAISASSIYIHYLKYDDLAVRLGGWDYLNVGMPALSMFYIVRYLFENRKINFKLSNQISYIASLTFGIYLCHGVFISRISKIIFTQEVFMVNQYISIISTQIAIFIVCGLGIAIFKITPVVKKFL